MIKYIVFTIFLLLSQASAQTGPGSCQPNTLVGNNGGGLTCLSDVSILSSGDLVVGSNVSLADNARLNVYSTANSTSAESWLQSSGHGNPANNCPSLALPGFCYNSIYVSADDMTVNTSTVGQANAFSISDHFGGANTTGARTALFLTANLDTADNPSNTLSLFNAIQAFATSSVSDGGSATPGLGRGGLWAMNPFVCLCNSAATNWSIMSGGEVNMSNRGGSVDNRLGWYIFLDTADSVAGRVNDFAFGFMSNGSAPFKQGFVASDLFTGGKSPIAASGTFIGENFTGGPYTITNGVDLSGWFFTGNAFRSPSFQVDGSGNLTANSFSQGANAGVDCLAGVTAATVVVHKGIVTHC